MVLSIMIEFFKCGWNCGNTNVYKNALLDFVDF
jgi:hypothetical protein